MNTDEFLYKLNNATPEDLRTIPRIGPVLADRLLAARPFQSIDDVKAVKGISTRLLDQLVEQGQNLTVTTAESNELITDEYPVEVETGLLAEDSLTELDDKISQEGQKPGSDESEILTDLEEEVPDLEEEVPDVEGDIPDLEGDVPDLEKDVPDVNEVVPDLEENIEEETDEAEEAAAQSTSKDTSAPDGSPVEQEDAAPQPVEILPLPVEQHSRQRGSLWKSLLSNTITALAAILLTLAILGGLNGSLKFATGAQYQTAEREAAQLAAKVDALQQDLDGLRERVDTLEGLGGRTIALEEAQKQFIIDMQGLDERADTLENAQQQLTSDLEAASQQVAELQSETTVLNEKLNQQEERTSRFETFLQGLQTLLGGLFAQEGETQ